MLDAWMGHRLASTFVRIKILILGCFLLKEVGSVAVWQIVMPGARPNWGVATIFHLKYRVVNCIITRFDIMLIVIIRASALGLD